MAEDTKKDENCCSVGALKVTLGLLNVGYFVSCSFRVIDSEMQKQNVIIQQSP